MGKSVFLPNLNHSTLNWRCEVIVDVISVEVWMGCEGESTLREVVTKCENEGW